MTKIKAILFDLDDTLINRRAMVYKMYTKFALDAVPELKNDTFELENVVQSMILRDQFGTYSERGYVYDELIKSYNLSEDLKVKYLDMWIKNAGKEATLFNDTIDVLTYLKKNYQLAIVTNGNSFTQRDKIEHAGIKDYFDEIIVSGDYSFRKPDKDIYELVCKKLNVEPNECIFVGDIFKTDIIGAHRYGMHPIVICSDPNRVFSEEIDRIYCLNDLKARF